MPAPTNRRQASTCRARKPSPSTGVATSRACSPVIPPRRPCGRACSSAALLPRMIAVVSHRIGGRGAARQSASARRTRKVLVNAANKTVMAPTTSHTAMRAVAVGGTAACSPLPPEPRPPAGPRGSRTLGGGSSVRIESGVMYSPSPPQEVHPQRRLVGYRPGRLLRPEQLWRGQAGGGGGSGPPPQRVGPPGVAFGGGPPEKAPKKVIEEEELGGADPNRRHRDEHVQAGQPAQEVIHRGGVVRAGLPRHAQEMHGEE